MRTRIGVRLRATSLTFFFAIVSCAGSSHEGIDDSPATRAKIDPELERAWTAGLSRDVLVELDEAADTNDAADAGLLRDAITGAIQTDLDDLPPSAADPMRAALLKSKVERYGRLQDRVVNSVDPNDVALLHQYENLPLLFVRIGSLRAALELAAQPEVLRLHEDAQLQHSLTESLPLIHQPETAAAGKTGAGTAVAVLDTGCDFTRSAFGSCSAAGATGCKVAYAKDFASEDNSRDDNGHGTNVSAIVLGVAPSTKILALDVFDGSSAASSTILQAIDWTIQQRSAYNIVAINLSLGGGLFTSACTSDVFASALANARAAGIVPAVASGNDASSTSIASPACVPAAIAVGAVYDSNVGGLTFPSAACSDSSTSADKIACFSNSNALLSVLAPGAPITAGGYTMSGTSQATPHVAGALAVVRAALPNEALNESVARITGSGPSIVDPRNGISRHRLDLFAAVGGGAGTVSAPPDRTGPTGSVVIDADAVATKSTSVTLTINASDESGLGTMCIANTTSCTSFGAYSATKTWTLTSGDGMKTVTVIVKDSQGNASTFSDTIRLDATAPSGGSLSAQPGSELVRLSWTAALDAGSGIAGYAIVVAPITAPPCSAGSLVYSGAATSFTHTGLVNGNVYAYHLCPIDRAGNLGTGSVISARPAPEFDPPHGSVVIDAGLSLTASAKATLTLTAADASGVASMCISNTTSCSAFIAYATTQTWTLGSSNGTTSVYAWFRDVYGNTSSAPVSATIRVDTLPPAMGTFTASSAANSGTVQLSWGAASDVSGIASYKLVWQAGTTAPGSCAVGNLVYSGIALSFTHSGRTLGNYSYRLCSIDRAGNVSSGASRSVTVR